MEDDIGSSPIPGTITKLSNTVVRGDLTMLTTLCHRFVTKLKSVWTGFFSPVTSRLRDLQRDNREIMLRLDKLEHLTSALLKAVVEIKRNTTKRPE